ncbi:MAG: hypothetical protein Q9200_007440, partial [Gallowayella weberi]
PPSDFSSRETIFLNDSMPKSKTSSQRRRALVLSLGPGVPAMRPCRNCVRSNHQCRLASGSEKCIECVRTAQSCELASLDTNRLKRLEAQREKLRVELREAYERQQEILARQQRLLRQLDHVENEQRSMINNEILNIEDMERDEAIQ